MRKAAGSPGKTTAGDGVRWIDTLCANAPGVTKRAARLRVKRARFMAAI
jgi:hypothetical protein